MEKSEQRFAMKFLFIKSLSAKAIHTELAGVLGSTTCSLSQINESPSRFVAGDLSCEDEIRPTRPRHVLGKPLSHFLEEFPFASTGLIGQHCSQSKHTINEILQHELGPGRLSPSLVRHPLWEAQEADRTAMRNDRLSVLYRQEGYSFSRIVTCDEF
jgi:hypothetical protein